MVAATQAPAEVVLDRAAAIQAPDPAAATPDRPGRTVPQADRAAEAQP